MAFLATMSAHRAWGDQTEAERASESEKRALAGLYCFPSIWTKVEIKVNDTAEKRSHQDRWRRWGCTEAKRKEKKVQRAVHSHALNRGLGPSIGK